MKQTGEFRGYYIVFTNEARLNWFYKLFTRENFRHCEVYMDLGEASVSVCHSHENVEVTAYPNTINEVLDVLKTQDVKILYLPTFKKPRKLRLGIMIPSCVGNCMLVTGVSFNCLSVHRYYKALLKHGAVEI